MQIVHFFVLFSPAFCHSASSLLGRDTLLSAILSNILITGSSIDARDQISYPYKATCAIIYLWSRLFSGMLRRLALVRTELSEESVASIFTLATENSYC
jgi:predicted benzoate:H+ symporter BenE